MSRAVSPSVDRVYGLVRVARCWNVSRATVYRHQQAPAGPKHRPGPVGPGDDAALLQPPKMPSPRAALPARATARFGRLRFAAIRTSPGRVRRLMRRTGCWRRTGSASGRTECTTAPSPPRWWTSCGRPT